MAGTFWNKSARKFMRISSKTDSLRKKVIGILVSMQRLHKIINILN